MRLSRHLACLAPLLLLLLALGAAMAHAAPLADCPAPPAEFGPQELPALLRQAQDHGFLWRLRRDGRESFLYGTIHVARRDWFVPGPQVSAALRSVQALAPELDLSSDDVRIRIQQAMVPPAGRAPLPATVLARLAAAEAAACPGALAAASAAVRTRPEMRAIGLLLQAGRRVGLEPSYSIDAVLAAMAHALQKDVRSLETPEEQMQMLVSDDPAEIAQSVTDMLDELARGHTGEHLERMAAAWRDGRLDELENYAQWCDCMNTERERAAFARMVDSRNAAMASKVSAWHGAGQTVFVAVGSLHLVGPQGLPALLRDKGFTLERVAFAPAPAASSAMH